MDKNYVKDMLADIKNLAEHQDINSILAMCENEIEELDKLTEKQEIINVSRIIEDAKYELTRLRYDDIDGLYAILNDASKILRNWVIEKELNTTATNENV